MELGGFACRLQFYAGHPVAPPALRAGRWRDRTGVRRAVSCDGWIPSIPSGVILPFCLTGLAGLCYQALYQPVHLHHTRFCLWFLAGCMPSLLPTPFHAAPPFPRLPSLPAYILGSVTVSTAGSGGDVWRTFTFLRALVLWFAGRHY